MPAGIAPRSVRALSDALAFASLDRDDVTPILATTSDGLECIYILDPSSRGQTVGGETVIGDILAIIMRPRSRSVLAGSVECGVRMLGAAIS